MADSKVETIQEIYAAFGRGDVDTIVSKLTDDVDWSAESAAVLAPWHGPYRAKSEVPRFFEGISKSIDVSEFTPLSFTTNDTDVMATITFGYTSRDTGKSATSTLHHWWRFRGDKVCFYRGTEDTALTAATLSI